MSARHDKPKPITSRPTIKRAPKKSDDLPVKQVNDEPKKDLSDSLLIARLVIAAAIFAATLIMPELSALTVTIMLIISTAVAGYDLILAAMDELERKNFLSSPILVLIIAFTSFFIGYGSEGAAAIILYQLCIFVREYAADGMEKWSLELTKYRDESIRQRLKAITESDDALTIEMEAGAEKAASTILTVAMGIAVLYAVLLPIVTSNSFSVSIHRAMMIIIVCTPGSVIASMPVTALVALCYAGQQGVVFKNASLFDRISRSNCVVFDAADIFTADTSELIGIKSDVLDKDTFITFAAHAAYYSSQSFAAAIREAYDKDYKLEVVSDFNDIPGFGVTLKIGGAEVTFMQASYYAKRGVAVPENKYRQGSAYYMFISQRFVGYVVVSSGAKNGYDDLTDEMTAVGFDRKILITEEGNDHGQQLADRLRFDDVICGCDTERKLKYVADLCESRDDTLFVYSAETGEHSKATLDMQVTAGETVNGDAAVMPDSVVNIPFAKQVAIRMNEVAKANAIFVFVIKAIIIFLSIVGVCTLWFALFLDSVAAIAAMLNSVNVIKESYISNLKYKFSK